MKVKKILPAFVLTAFAALGLASCGPTIPEAPEIGAKAPITVWATEAEIPVIESIVAAYNATQTVEENKFDLNLVAVAEGDAGTQLAADATQEGAPALFLTADDHIYNLYSKNILLEITGVYKEIVTLSNSAVSVQGSSYGDKLLGFPVTSDNGYFLWYNSAEVTADQAKSLETLLQVAQQKGKKVLIDLPNGWYANTFLMSPEACGTESLRWNVANGKVSYTSTWDNQTGVKVSEYIGGLLKPYFDNGTLVPGGNDVIEAGFQDESMIAAVSGNWMETPLKGACETIAATKLPTFTVDGKAHQMASFTGSKVYCVNKVNMTVQQQKTAVALAQLLTETESQLERFETRQTLPCNNTAAADPRYTEHVTISGMALNMQNAAGACVQSLTAENRYWDIGKAIGQAYLDGNLGDYANWQEFLTAQMNILRQAV